MKAINLMRRVRGFTIVELAIVIVIIAILATITMVAYGSVREQSRDTQRITDMKNISEALKVYGNSKKSFPNPQPASGWETSMSYASSFIMTLKDSGLVGEVPIDPQNDGRHYYRYYRYPAGQNECDASKGPFYILQVVNVDKGSMKPKNNPGFSCASRNWTNEAWYTTGGFLYE